MLGNELTADLLGSLTDEEYFQATEWARSYNSVRSEDYDGMERVSFTQALSRAFPRRLPVLGESDMEELLEEFVNLLIEEIEND